MHTLKLKDVELGSGLPKIIVPITERTDRTVWSEAKEYKCRQADMIEWRADYYKDIHNTPAVMAVLKKLHRILSGVPLIFTCRPDSLGGASEFTPSQYYSLNQAVAESGMVDAIDLDINDDEQQINSLITEAHMHDVKIIGSYDNPETTPSREELIDIMRRIQALGVDIVKVAVMVHSSEEALRLMDAAREMVDRYAECPIIAMGMGSEGVITRITCESVGTCATYGAIGEASAPGQFPVERLQTAIKILHIGMTSRF